MCIGRGSDLDEHARCLDMNVVVAHGAWYPDDADALFIRERIDSVVNAVVGFVVVFVVEDDEACAVWVAVMEHQPSVQRLCDKDPVLVVWDTHLELKRTVHNDRCWYVNLHRASPPKCATQHAYTQHQSTRVPKRKVAARRTLCYCVFVCFVCLRIV